MLFLSITIAPRVTRSRAVSAAKYSTDETNFQSFQRNNRIVQNCSEKFRAFPSTFKIESIDRRTFNLHYLLHYQITDTLFLLISISMTPCQRSKLYSVAQHATSSIMSVSRLNLEMPRERGLRLE